MYSNYDYAFDEFLFALRTEIKREFPDESVFSIECYEYGSIVDFLFRKDTNKIFGSDILLARQTVDLNLNLDFLFSVSRRWARDVVSVLADCSDIANDPYRRYVLKYVFQRVHPCSPNIRIGAYLKP